MISLPSSERLSLRAFCATDVEMIFRLHNDPKVMRYMPEKARKGIDRTTAEAFVSRALAYPEKHPGLGFWVTIERATGNPMGWACLKLLDQTQEVEIGYRYLPEFWGKGYGTEISRRVMAYGFESLALPRIVGITQHGNLASQRVLEKIGLIYEKDAQFYDSDVRYYALSLEDWCARRKATNRLAPAARVRRRTATDTTPDHACC